MSGLLFDLRTAVRALCRRPFYPMVALAILVIGLSAGIAVFTYINAFYQPFPGVDAGGLVQVYGVEKEGALDDIAYLDFLDYAALEGPFEGMAATSPFYAASVRLESVTELAYLEAVSGGYFSVLGIGTALGRSLLPGDDEPGATPATVLSHPWWMKMFNGDPGAIGQTIFLNYRPFVVVGVASPGFLGTISGFRPDLWIPFADFRKKYSRWNAYAEDRDVPLVRVYGRLRDGVGRERAMAELQSVAAGLDDLYPRKESRRRLRLDAAHWIDRISRNDELPTLRLMIAAAAGLLLLVCANVANLLLSVAAGRQRELAMRAALGASSGRLLRQVLVENVLLASVAGGLALLLAVPLSSRLGSYFARPDIFGMNAARELRVDLRVVLFAIAISLVTGLLAGLLPALRASRRNLVETLNSGGGAIAGRGAARRLWGWRLPGAHDLLIAAQATLAMVLLVFAGLILRTFVTVRGLDPGFSCDHLAMTHVSTSSTDVTVEDRERLYREMAERLGDEPWVQAATVVDFPPLSGHPTAELRLDGRSETVPLIYSKVIPGFFEALDIGVLEGRSFKRTDISESPDVAIINDSLARRFFAGTNPVGRRLWWPDQDSDQDRMFEIVGVVRDTKTRDLFVPPEPTVYFSYPQHTYPYGSALLVKTVGDPAASLPLIRRWLRDLEPHLAIVNLVTFPDFAGGLIYTHRMNAELFSGMAFLGLGLAAAGIFSVLSLAVSRRTREIGIRMSVGARRSDIGRLMVRRALAPVIIGLGIGLPVSLALAKLVRSLLYGVGQHDTVTLAAGTGVLVAVALLASYLPARRAARIDPVAALRRES